MILRLISFDFNYCIQENGDRHYEMSPEDIILRRTTVAVLKNWNVEFNSVFHDRPFLKKLAGDVFGMECLSKSSVLGKKANNCNMVHTKLDEKKCNFMKSKYMRNVIVAFGYFYNILVLYIYIVFIYSSYVSNPNK